MKYLSEWYQMQLSYMFAFEEMCLLNYHNRIAKGSII